MMLACAYFADDILYLTLSDGLYCYSNRQETYEYFQLPYCKGEGQVEHRHETLGEALLGMELVNSGISIRFGSTYRLAIVALHFVFFSKGYVLVVYQGS
jgi:hypothetical protein